MDVTIQDLLNPSFWLGVLVQAKAWIGANVLVWSTLAQIACVVALFLVSRLLAPRAGDVDPEPRQTRRGADPALDRYVTVSWRPWCCRRSGLILQSLSLMIAIQGGWDHHVIQIVVSLLAAWVIIRLTSGLLRDPVWSKFIAIIAWSVAALSILSLFDETLDLLDAIALRIGEVRVSLLLVIKGVISLALLLWIATLASRVFRAPHQQPAESHPDGAGALQQALEDRAGDHRRGGLALQHRHRPDGLCRAGRRHRRGHRLRPAEDRLPT